MLDPGALLAAGAPTRLPLLAGSAVILCCAVALAVVHEVRARLYKVQRTRPATAVLVLAGITITFTIVVIEHNPMGPLPQFVALLLLPLATVSIGAIRFPDGVPARDVSCMVSFFAFAGAASIQQCITLWGRRGALPVSQRAVRMALVCISTVGVLFHAIAVALHPSGLWRYSRCAFAFQGGVRLATTWALFSIGAESYPPTELDLASSLFVNATYVAYAFVFNLPYRCALSAESRRLFAALTLTPQRHLDPRCSGGDGDGDSSGVGVGDSSGVGVGVGDSGGGGCSDSGGGGCGDSGGGGGINVGVGVAGRRESATSDIEPSRSAEGACSSAHPTPANGLCVVCMACDADHAFISCGHICTCAACAAAIMSGAFRCPVCRQRVNGVLKIYRV